MSSYALSARSLDSGTTPGTFETLLAVKFADTLGHRGRLRSIHVGGDDDSDDIQITVKVAVTNNTTDGTAGNDVLADIAQKDANDIASRVAAAGSQYSGEPTTYGKPVLQRSCNSRGGIQKEWSERDAPLWGKNQTLGVLVTIGGGSTAAHVTIDLEWDE